jgi:hypothetical protein
MRDFSVLRRLAGLVGVLTCGAWAHGEAILRFQNDAEIRRSGSAERSSFKAGETYTASGSDVLTIEAKGRVPLVLVPLDTPRGTIVDITQPEVTQWPSAQIQATLDAQLSKILDRVLTVQEHLGRKRAEEAGREVDLLKAEYPGVVYLDFLNANVLLLKGNRNGAVEALKRALAVHPDNSRGQELLKALEGGSR